MLLLDSSFLIEFEDELASERPGPASALLAARRALPAAISIVTLGEFAEAFLDPVALNEFVSPFRILQLSRMIAWRAALLQTSLSRRLGENDAWIAATASWTDICEHVVGTNAPHRKSARAARSRPRLPQLQ